MMHDPQSRTSANTARRHPSALPWLVVAALGAVWLLLGQHLAAQAGIHPVLTSGLPQAAAAGGGNTLQTAMAPPRRTTSRTARPQHPQTATATASPSARVPSAAPLAARAVAFALAQVGKPYEWGAEGPNTYDCSGLTWRAWTHAGLAWSRMTARDQWRWLHDTAHGHDVPATGPRAGDLLFYATDPNDPATIHHVAMAIGHGRMVEAYAPGFPVRVTPIRENGRFTAAFPG